MKEGTIMRLSVIVAAIALVILPGVDRTIRASTQGKLSVTLENFSSFDNAFDVKDERCGDASVTLKAWAGPPGNCASRTQDTAPCSIRDAQIQSGPGRLFSAPGTSSRSKRRLHPIDYENWRIQPSSPDPWRRADTRRQGHTRTGQSGKVMFLSSVQLHVQWQQRHPTSPRPARPA